MARRCVTVDEAAAWIQEIYERGNGPGGTDGEPLGESMSSILFKKRTYSEMAANLALALIGVTRALLDRQIAAQARAFEAAGGSTERLHQMYQSRTRCE